MQKTNDISDQLIWMEEIDSPQVLDWVKSANQPTITKLEANPIESELRQQALQILNSDERIPTVTIRGQWVYNFWTDAKNPRGLYRRDLYQNYVNQKSNWQVLLDIDELNKKENKSWVFRGCSFFKPNSKTCLMSLSDAGRDAIEIREFDLEKKSFVTENTFRLPVGKHRTAWFDEDHLLVASETEKDALSKSGYPLRVRLWKRGQPFDSAKQVFQGDSSDAMVWMINICRPEGCYPFISRLVSFFETEIYYVHPKTAEIVKLNLPKEVDFHGVSRGELYIGLKRDESIAQKKFQSGDLIKVGLPKEISATAFEIQQADLVFRPTPQQSFSGVRFGKSHVYISYLDQVRPMIRRDNELWELAGGNVYLNEVDSYSDRVFVTTESPTTPTTLYEWNGPQKKKLKALPSFFKSDDLEVLQKIAVSVDGERIPYFLIRRKDSEKPKVKEATKEASGTTIKPRPTIISAYGGFQISQFPGYEGVRGKLWLERGGQFVVANIRGGGEFGPRWHQAALKANRQKAFNDLFAVTEDLQKQGYSTSKQTGFVGGSNGGLLAGAAMTQRPDLFGAIVIQVPLLDMKRFHKMLAGHSWIAEYGNPDLPEEWDYIKKYSPLHRLEKRSYPPVFLITSTRDDRVHPAHARKFAYRLKELGIPFEYFENIEGGHGAAADNTQRARFVSYMYTFFDLLFDGSF